MKLALIVVMTVTTSYCILPPMPIDKNAANEWELYKNSFRRNFKDRNIEIRKFETYQKNIKEVQEYNKKFSKKGSYKKGLNEFADLTHQEFIKKLSGLKINMNKNVRPLKLAALKEMGVSTKPQVEPISLPKKIDWRKKGAVTPIKNQKGCGACWAFSACAGLEGQYFKKTGELVSLSEQSLVDCVADNFGCDGGDMNTAFDDIRIKEGINAEAKYPYEACIGICRYNRSESVLTVKGFIELEPGNEAKLKEAVATIGPICVGVDSSSWHLYKDGIFFDSACSRINVIHGVTIVGYDTDKHGDYWIVKNSWGETWGIKGYMHLARNANNMCGIATMASYPVL